jgi:hypothetical protein
MSAQRARIAARAFELWEQRGRPEGSPEVDWAIAEREILGDVGDPTPTKTTVDALPQEVAEVVTSESDKGPTASNTEALSPEELNRPRPRRKGARQGRHNGAAPE